MCPLCARPVPGACLYCAGVAGAHRLRAAAPVCAQPPLLRAPALPQAPAGEREMVHSNGTQQWYTARWTTCLSGLCSRAWPWPAVVVQRAGAGLRRPCSPACPSRPLSSGVLAWAVLHGLSFTGFPVWAGLIPPHPPRPPCPPRRQVWIRQRGCSQGLLWRLEAGAVLEVEEVTKMPEGRREARFSLVEGDFKVGGLG